MPSILVDSHATRPSPDTTTIPTTTSSSSESTVRYIHCMITSCQIDRFMPPESTHNLPLNVAREITLIGLHPFNCQRHNELGLVTYITEKPVEIAKMPRPLFTFPVPKRHHKPEDNRTTKTSISQCSILPSPLWASRCSPTKAGFSIPLVPCPAYRQAHQSSRLDFVHADLPTQDLASQKSRKCISTHKSETSV